MSKPPKPLFTFFGVDGGATCSCVEHPQLFVGSQKGVVRRYGLESKIMEQIVHVDDEERRIQSVEFRNSHLLVHIRSFAVLKLRQTSNSDPWSIIQTIEVNHIGFCNSILLNSQLLFVSADNQRYALLCWTSSNGEIKKSLLCDEKDIQPMCMIVGDVDQKEVLIGMEDGSLAICYGDEDGDFGCHQRPKLGREPIFCVASSSKWVAAGCARSPIFLLDRENLDEKKEINYPPDSAGCSSITFSPNSKQILAGFWDGSIRVFSRNRLNVLLVLSNTHSSNVSSLHWLSMKELVIATSSDSTVSLWKLK
ncbi:unnamed protein product [Caenorhabditis brenneri]